MMDSTATSATATGLVLAIDLGKFKSVACRYDAAAGTHAFETIATTPAAVHDLLIESSPQLLVIEACGVCGWISDLAESLSIEVRVANVLSEAWKWRRVKRKTDRDDALKLAKLAASDQLPTVHVPALAVRQHRSLIRHRHALIDRRTGIKNTIRSLLDAQGLSRGSTCSLRRPCGSVATATGGGDTRTRRASTGRCGLQQGRPA
jgi:transposase